MFLLNWCKLLLKTGAIAILLVTLSLGLSGAWWDFGGGSKSPARESQLAQGDAITDPIALLRYALPIDNETVRQLQQDLEDISTQLRSKRWSTIERDISEASRILSSRDSQLLASIPDERQPQAETLISQLKDGINQIREAVEAEDKEQVSTQRRELLDQVGQLEELMVKEFPFEVPSEYSNLPQLKGRATVEVETNKGNLTVVVDGYSAPITAGNFVDLVERGFYDDLEFLPSQDFILQTGDPPGSDQGFVDSETGEYRAIPLEVLVRGDSGPTYGITLEDAGRYLDQPVLPFSANGAVALARPSFDPNGGSSQFFFFLFNRELTPPGFNLMDGRYAVFGYVVEGEETLDKLKEGDQVLSARVVEGAENLVQPQTS